jgi:hypothetical protein
MKIADIIIPHHDRHDHLKECLENIDNSLFNIIVVSGDSFAVNCNKGARLAETDNIIILNDDTEPTTEVFQQLCDHEADIVGCSQTIPSLNKVFHGIYFKRIGNKVKPVFSRHADKLHIPNGFMMRVKKKVWYDMGGFHEGFVNGGEDSDFGLRAINDGYSIGFIDNPIIHKHSQSKDRLKYHSENLALLKNRWSDERIIKMLVLEQERLNVLVATNHLDRLGGSETWTYTMYKELERLGHNVECFTLMKGVVSEKMNPMSRDEYDLILVNHNTTFKALADIKGYKVYTQHGLYCGIENAPEGANAYVGISPEIVEKNDKMTMITNGIDCDRFKPKSKIGKLKKVLCMCQGEQAIDIVRRACIQLGLELECIERSVWDVEDKINEADLVITLGRGAYESMACGRAVVVFDKRVYINKSAFGDGIVTKENWKELLKFNFSGRRYQKYMGVLELVKEIQKYDPSMGDINREIAEKHFNIKDKVNEYLKLYE